MEIFFFLNIFSTGACPERQCNFYSTIAKWSHRYERTSRHWYTPQQPLIQNLFWRVHHNIGRLNRSPSVSLNHEAVPKLIIVREKNRTTFQNMVSCRRLHGRMSLLSPEPYTAFLSSSRSFFQKVLQEYTLKAFCYSH